MINILIDPRHQLRSGWRFATFVILFLLLWVASGLGISIIFEVSPLAGTVALFVPAVGTTFFMVRVVDRAQFAAFGVQLHEGWLTDYGIGFGVAAAMLVFLVAASIVFGGAVVQWTGLSTSGVKLLATAVLLMVAAANEELVFRGYPMQVLMKGIGPWPAALAMSLLFGLLHSWNPGASALSTINTVLAGLLLSIAYLKTRSLWLPYGIHLGWNLGLGPILGYPVSGIPLDSLWRTTVNGSIRIFGGPYGPEGGLIGTVIFGGTALAVWLLRAPGVSPGIRAALAANAGKIYISEN